jgi:glycosyltransferase involved in cell wall biosynthesis
MYFYALSILRIPVIAVSDELGQLLRSTFKANVTVVNNGVDSEIFYREENDMLLALKGKSKIVLVFARSDYRKGFDIAIKVLQQYREQIEKGSLAVWAVGEHLPVPFPVNYFGFVGQEYLRKILSCSDVLLYPSRHEGLPLFVLEALFCSCPVVTTKAVKILTDGKDGVVCDIDNIACLKKAVTSLIEEEQFHQNVVQEGLRTAQKYQLRESKREFYRTLLALYNQRSGHLSSNFLKS